MNARVEDVLERLDGVLSRGVDRWVARCPAHDDHTQSLSITRGNDGQAVLHCHAGCEWTAISKALDIATPRPKDGKRRQFGKPIAVYDYHDEAGELLFQVVRDEHKNFRQRRPTGAEPPAELWTYSLEGVPRVLYRLPEVKAAVHFGHRIYVCEGEKDADAIIALGLIATTNPGGAGKWNTEHADTLKKARAVTIIPDNDDPGRAHAAAVKASLVGKAASVRVLTLPDLPQKGDVSDWIAAGGTKERLESLAASGPKARGWLDAADMVSQGVPPVDWIVPNLFSRPSLAMVSGDADAYKSWSLTQLCLCAATEGRSKLKWFDHFKVDAARAMLVTADEDRAETLRKIGWLAAGYELKPDAYRGRFLLWSDDLSFDDDAAFGGLVEDVEDFAPDIVVVDHLRVCFEGEENSSEFARKVKIRGRQIQRVRPCVLIWIHHMRKIAKEKELNVARQRVRGSGGLVQSFDHHVAFEADELNVVTITVDRNKKGRKLAPFCMDPRIVDASGTAILEYRGDAKALAGTSEAPGEVLQMLRSDPDAWTAIELEAALTGVSLSTIQRSLKVLEANRQVLVEGRGRSTKYTPRETADWTRSDVVSRQPRQNRVKQVNLLPDND